MVHLDTRVGWGNYSLPMLGGLRVLCRRILAVFCLQSQITVWLIRTLDILYPGWPHISTSNPTLPVRGCLNFLFEKESDNITELMGKSAMMVSDVCLGLCLQGCGMCGTYLPSYWWYLVILHLGELKLERSGDLPKDISDSPEINPHM